MTERVPVPDVAPMDPATIVRQHPQYSREDMPASAAHVISPLGNPMSDTRSRIEFWFRADVDEHFDDLIDTFTHEIHHVVLSHIVGERASYQLDNIAGGGVYLRDRQHTINDTLNLEDWRRPSEEE